MIKQALIGLLAAAALLAAAGAAKAEEGTTPMKTEAPAPTKTGHVDVNGVNYYYEVRAKGEPLLLLHGGLGSIDMYAPILPVFAENREVILVDLQGHGRTNLGDRPILPGDIADDLTVILEKLGYKQVDVLGYSFGGNIGFRLAAQHPDIVRRLVVASAPFAQDGFYPEMLPQQAAVGAGMAEMMKDTPMYKSYIAVAPNPEEFPKLLDAMGAWMRTPYDWKEDVKGLTMPVMLIYGDSDMIRLDHVVEVYNLLGGGLKDAGWQRENMPKNRLAILPNVTHYEMFLTPEFAETVLPFLNGETGAPTWAAQVDKAK